MMFDGARFFLGATLNTDSWFSVTWAFWACFGHAGLLAFRVGADCWIEGHPRTIHPNKTGSTYAASWFFKLGPQKNFGPLHPFQDSSQKLPETQQTPMVNLVLPSEGLASLSKNVLHNA